MTIDNRPTLFGYINSCTTVEAVVKAGVTALRPNVFSIVLSN